MKKIVYLLVLTCAILNADIMSKAAKAAVYKQAKSVIPMKIDASTTMVDFSIQGDTYVYTFNVDKMMSMPPQNKTITYNHSKNTLCSNQANLQLIKKGLSYTYKYRNTETHRNLYTYNIDKKACRGY